MSEEHEQMIENSIDRMRFLQLCYAVNAGEVGILWDYIAPFGIIVRPRLERDSVKRGVLGEEVVVPID